MKKTPLKRLLLSIVLVGICLFTMNAFAIASDSNPPELYVPEDVEVIAGDSVGFAVYNMYPDSAVTYDVVFAAENLPNGAIFEQIGFGYIGTTGRFGWSPESGQVGEYTVTFKMYRDEISSENLLDTKDVKISVVTRDNASIDLIRSITAQTEGEVSFKVRFRSDDGSGDYYIEAGNLPEGAVYDRAKSEFTWTPTVQQVGVTRTDFLLYKTGNSTAFVDSNSVFIYVTSSIISDSTLNAWSPTAASHKFNMTINVRIVDASGVNLGGPSNLIGVFVNDACRTLATPVLSKDSEYRYKLNIGADTEGELLSFKYMNVASGDDFELKETVNFASGDAGEMTLTSAGVVSDVDDGPSVPSGFKLHDNYPNPFNPETTISFSINRPANVNLSVYSVTGALVKTLVSGSLTANTHHYKWNGTNSSGVKVASGVYLYVLRAGDKTSVKKMMLIK